jgi:hypothetical protein
MNVFRVSVIILALALIAGAVVHIRLKNWHYAYLINGLYDQHQRLQRDYWEARLELARYQSPDNLLDRLKELKLPLEGIGLTPEVSDNASKKIPAASKSTGKSGKRKAGSHGQ